MAVSYYNSVIHSDTGGQEEVLSATKTCIGAPCGSGNHITCIISIVNSGDNQYTGLSVEDDMSADTCDASVCYSLSYVRGTVRYFVNGVLQAAPLILEGPPLVISGITVPAEGNVTVVYEAAVSEYAPQTDDDMI